MYERSRIREDLPWVILCRERIGFRIGLEFAGDFLTKWTVVGIDEGFAGAISRRQKRSIGDTLYRERVVVPCERLGEWEVKQHRRDGVKLVGMDSEVADPVQAIETREGTEAVGGEAQFDQPLQLRGFRNQSAAEASRERRVSPARSHQEG